MATTVSYSASMRTRKTSSSSNAKSSAAAQEFYDSSYNYVGIVHFSGMALANKVISGISLRVTSPAAGYGAGHTKTVYVRKSNYQAVSQSGVAGRDYYGEPLGTFTGSFYDNTTSYTLSGQLLDNLAAYFSAGNNTICLFNPSPVASSHGYSTNYLQWTDCTITVTYEEASSVPTMSAYTIEMGSPVTIYTNRQSTAAAHTVRYSFFNTNQVIAQNVGDSCTWTPPISLADQIPKSVSGWGTLYCDTYVNGSIISTKSCTFTLNVPSSMKPTISQVNCTEAVSGISAQFGGYVRGRSQLKVVISAAGTHGSAITSYRSSLNGTVYTTASFTTNVLKVPGNNTLSISVTDSRGRSYGYSYAFNVLDYSPPSLTGFSAERCNSNGTAPQMDGTRIRISVKGSIAPVDQKNTATCIVYFKNSSAAAWSQATTLPVNAYSLDIKNHLLTQGFNSLNSYDIKVRLQDYFYAIEQVVSVGTKQVMMDFYKDGSGIAFGKVAEQPGKVEFGWPVSLSSPLGVDQGGTGANAKDAACQNIGAVKKSGDTMTGDLNIQGYLYPSLKLRPTYNQTTNHTVFEGSYVGASSFSSWQDSTGNNRRMLEIRNASAQSSLDNSLVLRDVVNGNYYAYRIYHDGMSSPVPISKGGTGATNASSARANLGMNNASELTTGTLSKNRLPFKFAYGSTSINGNSAAYINYSSAGFTQIPVVVATYSTSSGNWSGDNGAIKVYSKTTSGADIIVGGNFSKSRPLDWFAIGV